MPSIDFTSMLAKHGIQQPQGSAPAPQMAAVPAPAPAAPAQPASPAPQAAGTGLSLADYIEKIEIRAKIHGAVQHLHLRQLDPAGAVDLIKALDPQAEFETSLFKGNGGGRKGDKRAAVVMILIKKFGADVIGKTSDGQEVTASIWKDKMRDMIGALPLSEPEKAKVDQGIAGTLNPAMLMLEGRGFEMGYWEGDKGGVKSFNVSELAAGTNGNGHGNGGNGHGAA